MSFDKEIAKIRKAFSRVKFNIDQIGNGLLDNKKDLTTVEKKIEAVARELAEMREKVDKIEKSSKIGLILDKLKVLTENQKLQDKEIAKLKGLDKKKIVSPSKHKILGNKKTGKVHYSNCPYAARVRIENLEEFETVKDALKAGYSRCQCIFNN